MFVGGALILGLGIGMIMGDTGAGIFIGLGLGLLLQSFMQHKASNRPNRPDD